MFRSILQMKSYRLVSPICLNLMQCGVLLVAVLEKLCLTKA